METLTHRLAIGTLVAIGIATLVASLPATGQAAVSVGDQHRQALLAMLGGALVAAAWVPSLRLPAGVAAVLGKAAWLALVLAQPAGAESMPAVVDGMQLLLAAAATAVLWRAARREAQWNHAVPAAMRPSR